MTRPDWAVAIVGAGVVGCALAQALAEAGDGRSIVVLERERGPGRGITSRNSQVVHAGLYYPPGSRKARTCVAGNRMLWAWAERHRVGHRRTGKLVVATRGHADLDAQCEALEALATNAAACGVALERVDRTGARAHEPALPDTVAAGLWSPSSGIVDAPELCRSLLADAEANGVTAVFSSRVDAIEPVSGGFSITSDRGTLVAERVINAAGLHATTVAGWLGLERRLHAARGDYFRLRRPAPWRTLLYPVQHPGSPSVGVHLTLELDGGARLGPDLEWRPAQFREDFDGARGEAKLDAFVAAARRLLGPLDASDLRYDGCGVRPKLVGPGEPMADFEIVEHPTGAWHLLGIESPGLTASLALAHELAHDLARDLARDLGPAR